MSVKKVIGTIIGVLITGYGVFKILDNKEEQKYSDKWFDSKSDDEINNEREIVRQQYCSAGSDFSLGCQLERLLYKFDNVIRSRTASSSENYEYPKHREHGWYLSNDDD